MLGRLIKKRGKWRLAAGAEQRRPFHHRHRQLNNNNNKKKRYDLVWNECVQRGVSFLTEINYYILISRVSLSSSSFYWVTFDDLRCRRRRASGWMAHRKMKKKYLKIKVGTTLRHTIHPSSSSSSFPSLYYCCAHGVAMVIQQRPYNNNKKIQKSFFPSFFRPIPPTQCQEKREGDGPRFFFFIIGKDERWNFRPPRQYCKGIVSLPVSRDIHPSPRSIGPSPDAFSFTAAEFSVFFFFLYFYYFISLTCVSYVAVDDRRKWRRRRFCTDGQRDEVRSLSCRPFVGVVSSSSSSSSEEEKEAVCFSSSVRRLFTVSNHQHGSLVAPVSSSSSFFECCSQNQTTNERTQRLFFSYYY